MKIEANPEELLKRGVYKIENLKNGKLYIGSTIMTFIKRLSHHISLLRANKHKNKHLQNAWNKYGEESFKFEIVELCTKEECLIREQFWLDKLECKIKGYNINPLATGPDLSKETIEKRRQTMLNKYKNGELDHVKEIIRTRPHWNRGKKLTNTNHLKVKKTITEKVLQARKNRIEKLRTKYPEIYVYDINKNYLGKWRSSIDLQEWSLTEANNLPIINKYKNGKSGNPVNILKSSNIQTACKFGKLYKGLYFSYKPLVEEIQLEKLNKNGEV